MLTKLVACRREAPKTRLEVRITEGAAPPNKPIEMLAKQKTSQLRYASSCAIPLAATFKRGWRDFERDVVDFRVKLTRKTSF